MKKKILAALLVGIMILSLSACGQNNDSEKSDKKADKQTEETSTTESEQNGGADNMEDGYEIVDAINIESEKTKLSYKKTEEYTLENGEKVLLIYFDFTNINAGETSLDAQYNFTAFQDGAEVTRYATVWDDIEGVQNAEKSILSGSTLEVAIVILPDNWESPIKLRVDNSLEDDGETALFAQQQELSLQ